MSARQNKEREQQLQPVRIEYAKNKIESLGFKVTYEDKTKIVFTFNGHPITLFAYSGWHTGKTIKDGRGIEKLLIQLQ